MTVPKKTIMRILISLVFALLSLHVYASSWNCRNNDLEIHCSSEKCELSDAFTPFDVSIDTNGSLSVCAYSGCWEGKGDAMESGHHLLVSGTKLQWTGTNPGTADFIVAVDTSDMVGFVKGEGFAIPTTCSPRTK